MSYTKITENLEEMCAIASGELFKTLRAAGFEVLLCEMSDEGVYGHCFVMVSLEDIDYIVDVTASQFGWADIIVINSQNQAAKQHFWEIDKTFKDLESFRQHQLATGWGSDQVALP